jgi:DNA-binding CsgD family transcriptional regulator
MRADGLAFDFISESSGFTSAEGMGFAFQKLIDKFGFTDFLIGRLTPNHAKKDRGEVWAASHRSDWFEPWFKKNYRQDAGSDRARTICVPFRWTEMQPVYEARGSRILDEVREYGLSDGLTSSFPLEDGTIFGVTLGAPTYDLDPAAMAGVLLAGVYCGMRLAHLRHWQPAAKMLLSDRERECLRWVASGKTDWEISEILCISQQTVHKHVSNALKKLNSTTRAQAVAVALSSRVIAL